MSMLCQSSRWSSIGESFSAAIAQTRGHSTGQRHALDPNTGPLRLSDHLASDTEYVAAKDAVKACERAGIDSVAAVQRIDMIDVPGIGCAVRSRRSARSRMTRGGQRSSARGRRTSAPRSTTAEMTRALIASVAATGAAAGRTTTTEATRWPPPTS